MLPFLARMDMIGMAIKGYSTFPKPQHHRNLTIRLFSVISRKLIGGLTPLQRCSWCTLQPQLTGQIKYTTVGLAKYNTEREIINYTE